MHDLMGKKYLTEKEASTRYGYSQSWFARRRCNKLEPFYLQLGKSTRVLYPLIETDEWFRKKMMENLE